MKKIIATFLLLLLCTSFLISPVKLVNAQGQPPVNAVETLPPPTPEKEDRIFESPVRQPDLEGNANEGGTRDTGTSDSFGYTWTDEVPYNWVDATGGTQIALDASTTTTQEIPINFPFRFYGSLCDSLTVSFDGMVYCNMHNYGDAGDMRPFLSYEAPDAVGAVYYQTFGTAPNRYMVIAWHQFQEIQSDSSVAEHTFEVILYESTNHIKYQYQTVEASEVFHYHPEIFSYVLTENNIYSNYPQSNLAIQFTYPSTPPATITAGDESNQLVTSVRANICHSFSLVNASNVAERYEVSILSETSPAWHVSFFNDEFSIPMPLTDTGGAPTIDSGLVPAGHLFAFDACVDVPSLVNIGDQYTNQILLQSSSAGVVFSTGLFASAPFAVYETPGVTLYSPGQIQAVWFDGSNYESSINLLADGSYGVVYTDAAQENILFNRVTSTGASSPTVNITNNAAGFTGYYSQPVVASTPDGTMLIAWHESNGGDDVINLAFRNSDGSQKLPTTSLYVGSDVIDIGYPQIAATTDNRFMIIWDQTTYNESTVTYRQDIWHTILNSDGSAATAIINNTYNSSSPFDAPNVTTVNGTQFFMTYQELSFPANNLHYQVFSSNGSPVKSPVVITGVSGRSNHVQLSNGNIVMANNTHFYILNTSFNVTLGPIQHIDADYFGLIYESGFPGIMRDSLNHVVITSVHSKNDSNLNYMLRGENHALIDGLTGTIIFKSQVREMHHLLPDSPAGYLAPYQTAGNDAVDLRLAGSNDGIYTGEVSVINFSLDNIGLDTANNVVLTINLEAGVEYHGANIPCTASGQTITCTLSNLAYGSSVNAALNLQIPYGAAGVYQLDVSVSNDVTEANPVDNTLSFLIYAMDYFMSYLPVIQN